MLYKVALVSTVQQSKSAICAHLSPLFCISFPFRSPPSIEQSLLGYSFLGVICFMHSSVYMSIPTSQFIPHPGVHTFVLCVSLCFANIGSLGPNVSIVHTYALIYGICFSLSDSLYLCLLAETFPP